MCIVRCLIVTHIGPKCFLIWCKENQLDVQLFLNILRQPTHVSGVSRPIIRRYKLMYTTVGTNPTRTTDSHLKRIVSTYCCIHTVVLPPDDGPRYAQNM